MWLQFNKKILKIRYFKLSITRNFSNNQSNVEIRNTSNTELHDKMHVMCKLLFSVIVIVYIRYRYLMFYFNFLRRSNFKDKDCEFKL